MVKCKQCGSSSGKFVRELCKKCYDHWIWINRREQKQLRDKKWRLKKKKHIKEYNVRYKTTHRQMIRRLDKSYRQRNLITCRAKGVLYAGIKYGIEGNSWKRLFEFTLTEFKRYLEKNFKEKMCWENYGTYWCIDHKIPIAWFDIKIEDSEEFRTCFSLNNLQPLEKKKNYTKRAKYADI